MNNRVKEIVTIIGATAEVCGEFMRQFKKNGLSSKEARYLTGIMLTEIINTKSQEEI
jgi:hypothetical protein